MERYYEAYDQRYRQVHALGLRWSSMTPTPILSQVLRRWGIRKTDRLLEIGCGEGRDSSLLMAQGWDLLATDVSQEAVSFCRQEFPDFAHRFRQLDCLKDRMDERFDVIYAVAVLHMLVQGDHRRAFYRFFLQHLKEQGIGLVCTMGDGQREYSSGIAGAFQLSQRIHQETGRQVLVAGTSCHVVSMETFRRELEESGLQILEMGLTKSPPNFSDLLYAVVCMDKEAVML